MSAIQANNASQDLFSPGLLMSYASQANASNIVSNTALQSSSVPPYSSMDQSQSQVTLMSLQEQQEKVQQQKEEVFKRRFFITNCNNSLQPTNCPVPSSESRVLQSLPLMSQETSSQNFFPNSSLLDHRIFTSSQGYKHSQSQQPALSQNSSASYQPLRSVASEVFPTQIQLDSMNFSSDTNLITSSQPVSTKNSAVLGVDHSSQMGLSGLPLTPSLTPAEVRY